MYLCHVGVPFYHVADNNDLNEETLDGKGTTHCTNTIVVQPFFDRSTHTDWPTTAAQDVEPCRKRKRALTLEPEVYADFLCPKKVNPQRRSAVPAHQLVVPPHDDNVAFTDFAWLLSRASRNGDLLNPVLEQSPDRPEQKTPSWSAFNVLVNRDVPPRSAIGYCPVMNASPTEAATVYALLRKCLLRCQGAGLNFTLIVLDQAIYAKALDIVAHRQEEFAPVVLRLGAFHISCMFLAVIGKRFRDAGLMDILVESGIAGTASASAALDGRQYNRGVRFHKIVAEALSRLRWKEFIDCCRISDADVHTLYPAFKELQDCINDDNLVRVTSSPALMDLHKRYNEFCESQRVVPNFNLWSSYLQMVDLLLRFIRASRTANWDLHLSCVLEMLPWCFAYDRLNYARYMTYYWLDMQQLHTTHPDAHAFLKRGGFSVQRSDNPFAQVPSDQAIEQTINRASKTTGGIIGFSRHPATVQRWVLTAHDRAAVTDICLEHCGLDENSEQRDAFHKDCQKGQMVRDEEDVLRVIDTVSKLLNPFIHTGKDPCQQLTHLASGVEASKDASQDLLQAEDRGRECFHEFLGARLTLESGTSKKDFHDTISKLNLHTFTVRKKKTSSSTTDILRSDKSMFSRIALLAQTRQMDMREVLSFPLAPLPWSIATTSGSLVKTSKSILLQLLEGGNTASSNDQPTTRSALIIDGMALIRNQKLSDIPTTFGEFAEAMLKQLCRYFSSHSRVDFVVDTYRDMSIKNLERTSRASGGALRQHITGDGQRMPRQFAKFLAVGANKEELLAFLFAQWQRHDLVTQVPAQKVLVITAGSNCVSLTSNNDDSTFTPVPALKSTHEEADTRLLLHAQHAASNGYPTVTIKSPDTDVAVLAVAFSHAIPAKIIFLTGSGSKKREVDINAISDKLGRTICDALPGFHSFTGCDSTSAFAQRGKKQAFKLLCSTANSTAQMAFSNLGSDFQQLSMETTGALEKFVCQMYKAQNCSSVNDARYQLFCTKILQSNQLPPCHDAFLKHCCRANYQAAIWRRCLTPCPEVPAPHDKDQGKAAAISLGVFGTCKCEMVCCLHFIFCTFGMNR